MKIKKYLEHWRFFEDNEDDDFNYREDEDSWMNDKLDKKKKDDFDGWDYKYDYDDDSTSYDDDDSSYDEDDEVENLNSLLREMFRNSGINNVIVETIKMDITVTVTLNRREELKEVIKVFEVANKLKKDILAQYDSEVEMYDSWDKLDKMSKPTIVFSFLYDEGLYDDEAPF
jgi:hypothetical protein